MISMLSKYLHRELLMSHFNTFWKNRLPIFEPPLPDSSPAQRADEPHTGGGTDKAPAQLVRVPCSPSRRNSHFHTHFTRCQSFAPFLARNRVRGIFHGRLNSFQ